MGISIISIYSKHPWREGVIKSGFILTIFVLFNMFKLSPKLKSKSPNVSTNVTKSSYHSLDVIIAIRPKLRHVEIGRDFPSLESVKTNLRLNQE